MPNKKLRDGQPIGMGVTAPYGAKKPQKTGGKTPKQPTKAPKPKGGY
jgi:hypothetical protein